MTLRKTIHEICEQGRENGLKINRIWCNEDDYKRLCKAINAIDVEYLESAKICIHQHTSIDIEATDTYSGGFVGYRIYEW